MALIKVRERIKAQTKQVKTPTFSQTSGEIPSTFRPAWALGPVKAMAKRTPKAMPKPLIAQQVRKPFPAHYHRDETRDEGTLYAWRAQEHGYTPKSARWYIGLAIGITLSAGLLVFFGNVLGAIAVALVGILIYTLAQREPDQVRYRLMAEGLAINDRLYHYQDLDSFNIIYEPGQVKTVLVKSQKMLSPLIEMEIGSADPLEIRDILLEFLREDLNLQEPITDTWARRLGF